MTHCTPDKLLSDILPPFRKQICYAITIEPVASVTNGLRLYEMCVLIEQRYQNTPPVSCSPNDVSVTLKETATYYVRREDRSFFGWLKEAYASLMLANLRADLAAAGIHTAGSQWLWALYDTNAFSFFNRRYEVWIKSKEAPGKAPKEHSKSM